MHARTHTPSQVRAMSCWCCIKAPFCALFTLLPLSNWMSVVLSWSLYKCSVQLQETAAHQIYSFPSKYTLRENCTAVFSVYFDSWRPKSQITAVSNVHLRLIVFSFYLFSLKNTQIFKRRSMFSWGSRFKLDLRNSSWQNNLASKYI